MIAKRFGAVVVAVVLVVAAFAVRDRMDRQDDLDRSPLRVVCATELGAACERLRDRGHELVVEDALVTAQRLATAEDDDVGTEVWLTVQPAAALVNANRALRSADPLIANGAVTAIASTDLALVVWDDRGAVLRKACPTLTLRCVGEVAGRGAWSASGGRADWGQVRVALPDPETQASGAVALGTGAQSWFGRADVGSNDFDADPAFGDWLAGLARAVPADGSLPRMLALGRAALDMAVVPRAIADEQTRGATDIVTLAVAPATRIEAVAVVLPGSRGSAKDVAGAVEWPKVAVRGSTLAPDVLEALRLRWRELTR